MVKKRKETENSGEFFTIEQIKSRREELNTELGFDFQWGDDPDLEVVSLPLGIHSLDEAMNGGIPFSRFTIFWGDQAAGKTTLALLFIAAAQREGLACAFIDVEKKLDPSWAKAIGVDIENLIIARPRTAEKCLEVLVELSKRNFGVIVLDSIAAMATQAELEASSEKKFMGEQARITGDIFKRLNAENTMSAIIMIDQVREHLGITFGNPETMPGGRAVRFYPALIIRVRRGTYIEEGTGDNKAKIGYNLRVVVDKDQHGQPFKDAEVPFYFTGRIDQEAALFATALSLDVITQKGPYFYFGEEKVLGKAGFIDRIKEDAEFKSAIQSNIDSIKEVD